MNLQKTINTLLFAIRNLGLDIKIDTFEVHSDRDNKYFKLYKLYTKEDVLGIDGKYEYGYFLVDTFTSKADLIKTLIEIKNKVSKRVGDLDG